MGANEVGTLEAFKAHRRELLDIKIAEHNGRIFKLTGDGILVEFPSVVNAVSCAVDIQKGMSARNMHQPDDRVIQLRIGVNIGDVIVEGDDIFGDGVNVAARLESIAKPGGVTVASSVREQIGNRLDVAFVDSGEHSLKNISAPIRVFDVVVGPGGVEMTRKELAAPRSVFDAGKKPSIAVLPFTNMSGDVEQEYFSDGITEDIITDLSQISSIFVVGRNSVFTYKGRAVNLQQTAKELGVRYLLEGSVRKAGQRVRITGQLIDGETGGHLWAARYDRELDDIFAVQDEIAHTIVEQLKVKLMPEEKKAIEQAPTSNVEAYTSYLKGRQFYQFRSRANFQAARQMFVRAIEIDPSYARAYAGVSECDSFLSTWYGVEITHDDILAMADKALAIDPTLPEAHAMRAVALLNAGRRAEAATSFERALVLGPNCYEANYFYARYCFTEGELASTAAHYIRALEIQLDDYKSPCLLPGVLQSLGRNEEAVKYARLGIKRIEEALRLQPDNFDALALGASTLTTIGENEQAKAMLARALVIERDPRDSWYNIACTYSQLGEQDRAIELLEAWLPKVGPDQRRWMAKDPDLDPIRSHPRFKALTSQFPEM
jgi:adenylate cyclase